MSFRIATNTSSLHAQRRLGNTYAAKDRNIRQMAAGSRIVEARDDAAGLAISENLKSKIMSRRMAARNTNEGISFVQMAEGGLNEVSNIMTRLRELAIQSANDSYSDFERQDINTEYIQMKSEIQRIAESTKYGASQLLDGNGEVYDFQVDINNEQFQDRISFDSGKTVATIDALGIESLDVASKEGAQSSLEQIDRAVTKLSKNRSRLGAYQNRLISTVNNLSVSDENQSAANSRIRDLDYAQASALNAKK
jgi:flagellin